jgi:hypothetical protein
LINNRQNGRRRGRGTGGPRSPNQSQGGQGNRQDNRNRGNAAQLLEKYKSLARDAQMQGDRVQTETYLQYADHYFRVLNETRSRFEEQRPRREDYDGDEYEGEEDGNVSAEGDDGEDGDTDDRQDRGRDRGNGGRDRNERHARPERAERNERPERNDRPERAERPERSDEDRAERPRREFREDRNGEQPRFERPRPRREERRPDRAEENPRAAEPAEGTISLDVLPPAISIVDSDAPAKPVRRRTRRPRNDDDTDIAPAA